MHKVCHVCTHYIHACICSVLFSFLFEKQQQQQQHQLFASARINDAIVIMLPLLFERFSVDVCWWLSECVCACILYFVCILIIVASHRYSIHNAISEMNICVCVWMTLSNEFQRMKRIKTEGEQKNEEEAEAEVRGRNTNRNANPYLAAHLAKLQSISMSVSSDLKNCWIYTNTIDACVCVCNHQKSRSKFALNHQPDTDGELAQLVSSWACELTQFVFPNFFPYLFDFCVFFPYISTQWNGMHEHTMPTHLSRRSIICLIAFGCCMVLDVGAFEIFADFIHFKMGRS